MGRRARIIVEEKFSCAAQLEHTEALYRRLTTKKALQSADHVDSVQSEVA